ncbi:hypothetical protein BC937DRAFT_94231 [Endogone sp. FLAS-F59071]|nr:hypothetical protein BC937DRAFT_94231 [Endogone sp. FLAS-F59071]|eukprot:RUS20841.1 hypothetical protein BC937DRAFT_94231 [Endogone sp. FLAS-F59071]
MLLEKIRLSLESIVHGFTGEDVLLRTVDDANEAKLEGVGATREDVESVSASVHEIEFGEDTDRATALKEKEKE